LITKTTLKPGQKGTKRLMEKYGERLLAVRYKHDPQTGRRYLTVELVEEIAEPIEAPMNPSPLPATKLLGIRVEYWETEIQRAIKAAGGIWRPRQRLWELRYTDVIALALESRVVPDDKPGP